MMVQKGGQVTKPIIVVKMPCKLLYVIKVLKRIKLVAKYKKLLISGRRIGILKKLPKQGEDSESL